MVTKKYKIKETVEIIKKVIAERPDEIILLKFKDTDKYYFADKCIDILEEILIANNGKLEITGLRRDLKC